jgi:hypothetical protein
MGRAGRDVHLPQPGDPPLYSGAGRDSRVRAVVSYGRIALPGEGRREGGGGPSCNQRWRTLIHTEALDQGGAPRCSEDGPWSLVEAMLQESNVAGTPASGPQHGIFLFAIYLARSKKNAACPPLRSVSPELASAASAGF